MINIYYADKDKTFYNDLSSWLPDYCSLSPIFEETSNEFPSFNNQSDIILLNLEFVPGKYDFLQKLFNSLYMIPVIILSESISLPLVISSIKKGAYSYIQKKKDKSLLIDCIMEILSFLLINGENSNVSHSSVNNIIGNSTPLINLKREILNYRGNDMNILLSGETGTGKELVAKSIHSQNYTNNEKMVSLNCGAIPDNLLESELFGTKKGAFTDSVNKVGLFKIANNSTIFLDEIAELSKPAQVKLLRVLESGVFTPVGEVIEEYSNFRLIAATNKNLKKEVEMGNFREDLYYRITSLIFEIPSLRERRGDIQILSHYFLNEKGSKTKISYSALHKLNKYHWPGNIRELKQTVLRAKYLSNKSQILDNQHIRFY